MLVLHPGWLYEGASSERLAVVSQLVVLLFAGLARERVVQPGEHGGVEPLEGLLVGIINFAAHPTAQLEAVRVGLMPGKSGVRFALFCLYLRAVPNHI